MVSIPRSWDCRSCGWDPKTEGEPCRQSLPDEWIITLEIRIQPPSVYRWGLLDRLMMMVVSCLCVACFCIAGSR